MQGDTYRAMNAAAQAAWQAPAADDSQHSEWARFTPGTNAVWLAYLCDVVRDTQHKGVRMLPVQRQALMRFRCALHNLLRGLED